MEQLNDTQRQLNSDEYTLEERADYERLARKHLYHADGCTDEELERLVEYLHRSEMSLGDLKVEVY